MQATGGKRFTVEMTPHSFFLSLTAVYEGNQSNSTKEEKEEPEIRYKVE